MATGSKLASVYIDIDVEMGKAEKELKEVSKTAKKETNVMAVEVGKNAKKMEEAISTAAQKAQLVVAGIGAAVIATGIDTENAFDKVQNGLGASAKEMEEFKGIIEEVATSGKGSFDEVAQAVVGVGQRLKGLQPDEVATLSKYALDLQKTFEFGINESTAAASILMNEFKMSGEEAFDYITAGAQQGLNFNDDLLDTIKEYSPLFKQSGFSADEMFTLLKQGAEEGTFNLDYLADLVKEVGIRFTDNSTTTSDAMAQMSKGTQSLWKDMQQGKATVQDVMNSVITDLEGMQDPLKRNELGVALMGTKYEDLGFDAVSALNDVGNGLGDVSGKTKEVSENNDGISESLLALKNQAEVALQPYSEKISEVLDKTTDWMKENPNLTRTIVGITGAVAAVSVGILALNGAIVLVRGAMTVWRGIIVGITAVKAAWAAITWTLNFALAPITLPIMAIVAAIGLAIAAGVAIYKNWDTIKEKAGQLKDKLKNMFDFKWKLPDLKLPHFSVTGKLDLFALPPKLPKLNVSWYANGGIFDSPTAFQKGNGLGILGEAGPEAIIPLSNDKRMQPFAEAIANMMPNNQGVYHFEVPVVIDGREVARATHTFTNDEINRMNKLQSRGRGVGYGF